MSTSPLLLLLLLHTVYSACKNSWEPTRCECSGCSTCYSLFDPSLQSLYLRHPRRSYFTRGVSFYSASKQLLLSLYIRRDGTAADVKCIGEERNELTEQQFSESETLNPSTSREWTIQLINDTILIQDHGQVIQDPDQLIQDPGQVIQDPGQSNQLAWNIHKLGCYNIINSIKYVEFVHLYDGEMCLSEVEPAEKEQLLIEDVTEDHTKDVHLVTNILIVMAVGCIVILMCIVALCKQCRTCVSKMFCLDCSCSRTSYNVSKMEEKMNRSNYCVKELVMTDSNDTDSERSNIVSLLQY